MKATTLASPSDEVDRGFPTKTDGTFAGGGTGDAPATQLDLSRSCRSARCQPKRRGQSESSRSFPSAPKRASREVEYRPNPSAQTLVAAVCQDNAGRAGPVILRFSKRRGSATGVVLRLALEGAALAIWGLCSDD